MKKLLFSLLLVSTGWSMPESYQKIDENYKLFNFSINANIHSSEAPWIQFEAPHGLVFFNYVTHSERMWIDMRRIEALGFLNVPMQLGMFYQTFFHPGHTDADAFQINAVFFAITSPKWNGLSASYEIDSLSNSGHQAGEQQFQLFFQNNFGLSDNSWIPFINISLTYWLSTGSGTVIKTQGANYTLPDTLPNLSSQNLVWQPRKGIILEITLDGKSLGWDGYLSGKFEHRWFDDPTNPVLVGQFYNRYGVAYGNSFWIGRDLKLSGEVGVDRLQDLWVIKAGAQIFLATNFN